MSKYTEEQAGILKLIAKLEAIENTIAYEFKNADFVFDTPSVNKSIDKVLKHIQKTQNKLSKVFDNHSIL